MCIQRGDVVVVNLSGEKGSEQGGENRCCVVLSNDIANKYSPVITIAPMTSKINKRKLPTHVFLTQEQYPLKADSIVLCEQLRVADKTRIIGNPLFRLNELEMARLDRAILVQMGVQMPAENNIKIAL